MPVTAGDREGRTAFATGKGMFERVLLAATIATASASLVACDTSEAAPSLPTPVGRDAGPDAGVRRRRPPRVIPVDAAVPDAGAPTDAAVPDAGPIDAAVLDAAAIDAAALDAAFV